MIIKKEKIEHILTPILEKHEYFLVAFVIREESRNWLLEIFVDNLKGVSTDDCAKISSELSSLIDEEGIIESKYRLDVSSPGLGRPLIFIQQFPKHLNRQFKITYTESDQTKKITGKLVDVSDNVLSIEQDKEILKINFNLVKKAKVVISFWLRRHYKWTVR